mgnify:CR=1 FL=1
MNNSIMKKYIHNWDDLNNEQKEAAKKEFKGNAALNAEVVHPAAKFFEENSWVKIDGFLDLNMCNLLYHHTQLEASRLNFLQEQGIQHDAGHYGTFSDTQAPGDFSKYGDPVMDALVSLSLAKIQELTALDLVPTYSYHRLYTTDTELKRHIDRHSCEISTTVCLGYDVSNVDPNTYPDWDWPMFIKEKNGKEVPVHMKPGDMMIYRGCDLEHWREPFWGKNHAQLFMHYNEKIEGERSNIFDNRPILGFDSKFKDGTVPLDRPKEHNKVESDEGKDAKDYRTEIKEYTPKTSKKIIY